MIAHQRRRSSWWRSVGIWAWWDGLGLRGIVSLGSVTVPEFMVALRRYGEILLRAIAAENIRVEVYTAAMSISDGVVTQDAGRYQPFKVAIEPVIIAARAKPPLANIMVEPLPVIF